MNLSDDQLLFLLPFVVSVIAVIVSVLSALYSKRMYEIEKAKYKFDKDRAEREFQEEIARQRPFINISGLREYFNLSLASDKNFAIDSTVIQRGEFSGKKRGIEFHLFPWGFSLSFGRHHKTKEDGQIVDLTNRSFYAEMVLANKSDISLWIDKIAIGILIKPKLPFIRFKNQETLFNGCLEWKYIYGVPDEKLWAEEIEPTLLYRILNKRWNKTHDVRNNLKPRILDSSTSNELSLSSPIELTPNSTKKFLIFMDILPNGERFLCDHELECYALQFQIFWGDEQINKEEEVEQHFYRLQGNSYNLKDCEVFWKSF